MVVARAGVAGAHRRTSTCAGRLRRRRTRTGCSTAARSTRLAQEVVSTRWTMSVTPNAVPMSWIEATSPVLRA